MKKKKKKEKEDKKEEKLWCSASVGVKDSKRMKNGQEFKVNLL